MVEKENSKKQIPLRLSSTLYKELAQWAEEDFRSINGQIEYLLTEAVRKRKKQKKKIDLELTGFADVFCYGDLWLELRPQNLNKRDAFLLAKKLSEQKEKYEYSYFADGKNDILMMQEVDCGFAVGDAAEELICLRKCQYIENISLYLKLVQKDLEK